MQISATNRLLSSIAARLRFANAGRLARNVALGLCIGFAVAMLLARLTGLLPGEWLRWEVLAALPVVSAVVALVFARRPALENAARAADAAAGSKDLFLAASVAGADDTGFAGVLREQAEARAATLKAAQIVPFRWWPGVRNLAVALLILAAGMKWLPQLDPLRMQQARAADAEQAKKLAESKKLTELRKVELKEKGNVMKEQVEQALMKLDKTLKDMKPVAKDENAKKLNEEAQGISELWKKASGELPKQMENVERTAQQFGDQSDAQEMKKMIEKLKKGDASGLKQAMENTRKKIEELSKMPEGAERQKQLEKLAKELAKMSNQMREQLGDKAANQAMQRALEQLAMAKDKNAAKEAMDAAAESMNLSKEEMDKLAQNFKDAENLEDALKNLAKAKELNGQGKLDGEDAGDAKSMEDYKKLYDELMAKNGMGEGQGEGQDGQGKAGKNPGIGRGGSVGEADVLTKTKDEKSKAKMGVGKLLMQWKEEGNGELGTKAEDYQEAVKAVKDGVAEAIRNERIPPGYHGSIQKYFDRLPEKGK